MRKGIPQAVDKAMEAINAIPFGAWASRDVQGIACELVESLNHEYDSYARLQALMSVQVRLTKALSECMEAERASLMSSAARPIYYAIGKSMLTEDTPMLGEYLTQAGTAMEAKLAEVTK